MNNKEFQDSVSVKITTDAKSGIKAGIAIAIISAVLLVVFYLMGYIVYITVAGVFVGIAMAVTSFLSQDPEKNPVFKALKENPSEIKVVRLVTKYMAGSKGNNPNEILSYSVQLHKTNTEFLAWNFTKLEREKALAFIAELKVLLPHLNEE